MIDRRLIRDVAAVAAASAFVGVSYGAIATASGLPAWAVIAMSVLVFAGGAQFLAAGLLAAGSPVAALVGGLLLNARHLPFGLAIADVFAGGWGRRLVGSHLMVDESVAFAMAQNDSHRRRAAYWATGVSLFAAWNLGTVLGVLAGETIGDPAQFGLDAAFPAALIALLLPRLRGSPALRVALVGATAAVIVTFMLPAGVAVLLSLLGLLVALPRRGSRSTGGAPC